MAMILRAPHLRGDEKGLGRRDRREAPVLLSLGLDYDRSATPAEGHSTGGPVGRPIRLQSARQVRHNIRRDGGAAPQSPKEGDSRMINEELLALLVCPMGKAPLRREG